MRHDGTVDRVSIRDAFMNAHELKSVSHPIPIVEFGLIRLLVAIAMDAIAPKRLSDLIALIKRGGFHDSRINDYLNENHEAFDLFSASHPFLQDTLASGPSSPVASLLSSIPTGTNVLHWHRQHDHTFAVSPGEAAGLLAAIAPFMTEGGRGLSPSINGAPPWYVMPEGRSVFETIVLNLWVSHQGNIERGVPAWRRESSLKNKERRVSASLLESFTWQPRSLRLIPGEGGTCSLTGEGSAVLVHEMHFTAGEGAGFDWKDPNVAYRVTPKGTFPVRPRQDRSPWRDIAALALMESDGLVSSAHSVVQMRPGLISQVSELVRQSDWMAEQPLRIRLYGMRTNHMKIFEWYRQELRLPMNALWDSPLQSLLIGAVKDTEQAQSELAKALGSAAARGKHKLSSEARSLILIASGTYWGDMERGFTSFATNAGKLNQETDAPAIDALVEEWRALVRKRVMDAFSGGVDSMRDDSARILSIERARHRLSEGLRFLSRPGNVTTEPATGGRT